MEKELDYLTKKIDETDNKIDICKAGINLGLYKGEDLRVLLSEKDILISILTKLTNYGKANKKNN